MRSAKVSNVAPRPFRLMVASRGAPDGRTIAEQARWAESVGFTHVAVHDHLAQRHAVTPVLAAVAMVTERVGLVPLVYNNDLRHPSMLARAGEPRHHQRRPDRGPDRRRLAYGDVWIVTLALR